jgi:hypothetical protein
MRPPLLLPAGVVEDDAYRGGAWYSSPDVSRYRYLLWRSQLETTTTRGWLLVIGLNPSFAGASNDDPTITRCCVRARAMGFSALLVANLFALRATNPSLLRGAADPIGPANDEVVRRAGQAASMILCAWGAHPAAAERARQVLDLLAGRPLHVLGLTVGGHPRHPLYMPYSLQPKRWEPR